MAVAICCGRFTASRKLTVFALPDGITFLVGRDLQADMNIGVSGVPITFPDEQLTEVNECRLCDSEDFCKIVHSDNDGSVRTLVADELAANVALDPSQACRIPQDGYKLHLKPGAQPCYKNQYPISAEKRIAMELILSDWEERGITERCSVGSQFNSPLLAVPKRDALGNKTGLRVCIDPRGLNDLLVDDNYPTPLVPDVFAKIAGKAFFTTIDLKEAYTQIPLHNDSKPLTAFTWNGVQYQFTRCIFGIKTMSSMFQRVINQVLEHCRDFATAYVDDIVVYSDSLEDHIKHVKAVLSALNDNHLRVNADKCHFGSKKIKLLGFLYSAEGVIPDQSRLSSIFDFPRPRSVTEVQRFLGVCNYIRNHIPRFADISKPLDAGRNSSKFYWTNEMETAFHNVKQAISQSALLACPRSDLPFYLATDASSVGLASMVYQIDETGDMRFISIHSRSLTPTESRYSANKRELLAVVFGLIKNQALLKTTPFNLLTDHQSLRHMFSQQTPNKHQQNWFDILASFPYSITHIPGKKNVIPDALSRAPCPIHPVMLTEYVPPPPIDPDLLHLQGHFQADMMLNWLRDRNISWPTMREDCEKAARSCVLCQTMNPAPPVHHALTSIDAATPFEHVQIDLVTDLPRSVEGFRHVLVLTDVASKFTILRPLADKSATSVASVFAHIIADMGPPKIVQTDQGREFTNALITKLTTQLGIDHRLASAYNPRTNGLVERTNRIWVSLLKKLSSFTPERWPLFLPATQYYLNTRITAPLKISPFEAFYCRKPTLFTDFTDESLRAATPEAIIGRIVHATTFFWPSLHSTSKSFHTRSAASFNNRSRLHTFSENDIVFLRNQSTGKFDPPLVGPFRIRQCHGHSYTLSDTSNAIFPRRVPTSQLRPAHPQTAFPSPTTESIPGRNLEGDDVTGSINKQSQTM